MRSLVDLARAARDWFPRARKSHGFLARRGNVRPSLERLERRELLSWSPYTPWAAAGVESMTLGVTHESPESNNLAVFG
jgi:hypothetical protein